MKQCLPFVHYYCFIQTSLIKNYFLKKVVFLPIGLVFVGIRKVISKAFFIGTDSKLRWIRSVFMHNNYASLTNRRRYMRTMKRNMYLGCITVALGFVCSAQMGCSGLTPPENMAIKVR